MALPSSPLMGGGPPALPEPTRGTSISLSLHSSGNNETGLTGKTLKKTNTQVYYNSDKMRYRTGKLFSFLYYNN